MVNKSRLAAPWEGGELDIEGGEHVPQDKGTRTESPCPHEEVVFPARHCLRLASQIWTGVPPRSKKTTRIAFGAVKPTSDIKRLIGGPASGARGEDPRLRGFWSDSYLRPDDRDFCVGGSEGESQGL